MKINVVLFAAAREAAGSNEIQVNVPDPVSVANLKSALAEQFPDLSRIIPRSAISVNCEYANDAVTINDGCEVALIPPVSGG